MTAQWKRYIKTSQRMHNTPIVDDDYPVMSHYFTSASETFRQLPEMPKIVCLCGSTKFKAEFLQKQFELTQQGIIVLSVGWFSHADAETYTLTSEEKVKLDELHKRKIDLADEIFVINVSGYIGSSTKSEIEYANNTNKPIHYLETYERG